MDLSDIDTGPYNGRKFILTIASIVLITAYSIVAGFYVGLRENLSSFIGGVLGVLSLYFTGNVMNKLVVGKVAAQLTTASGKIVGAKKTEGGEEDIT